MLPRTVTLWVKRALLLVLVVLIVLIVMQQMRASRAAKVAQGYAELDKAVTADDYDRVSANYAGTAIATQAQLSAAERLFEAGSYADAAERFAKAAAGKDAVLALRGMVGQGLALEAAATTAETMDTAKLTEAASAFGAAADKAATLE
jgi:hypothetical protein